MKRQLYLTACLTFMLLNASYNCAAAAFPCIPVTYEASGNRLTHDLGIVRQAIHAENWATVRSYIHVDGIRWEVIAALATDDQTEKKLRREYLNASLIRAAENSDPERIAFLLQSANVDVDTRRVDSNSFTPLMIASKCGHLKVAKALLHGGADVNAKAWIAYGAEGKIIDTTALRWAAAGDHVELVKLLLKYGADPNIQEELLENAFSKHPIETKGVTPLIAGAGSAKIEELLVKSGAKLNSQTGWGATALIAATQYGNADSITSLLSHGVNPCIKDDKGKTAFDYAKGKAGIPSSLLSKTSLFRCPQKKGRE